MQSPPIGSNFLTWQSHQQVLEAFLQHGLRSADLVGAYLYRMPSPPHLSHYPNWFLVDLGYALQIREWERQGLIVHLPVNLPSSKSVILSIADKLRLSANNPEENQGPDHELARKVTATFYVHFAHASSELHGDFVVKQNNSSDFIEAIAQWLWKNRSNHSLLEGASCHDHKPE